MLDFFTYSMLLETDKCGIFVADLDFIYIQSK